MLPNLSLQTSSSAASDAISRSRTSSVFDNSGFVVNYGSGGVSAGGALNASGAPMWLLVAAAIGGAWWLLKHKA